MKFKVGDRVIINNVGNPCACCTGKMGIIKSWHNYAPNLISYEVEKDIKEEAKNIHFYEFNLKLANSTVIKEKLGVK